MGKSFGEGVRQGIDSSGLLSSLLAVLFIGLKLCGQVDWPWWVVLSPLWGPFVFWVAVFVLICLILGAVELCRPKR